MGLEPAQEPYSLVSGRSCRQCGRPLAAVDGRSRDKRFCGDPCRMAYWDAVQRNGRVATSAPVQSCGIAEAIGSSPRVRGTCGLGRCCGKWQSWRSGR